MQAILVGVHPGMHKFGPISFGTYMKDVEPGTPQVVTPLAPTIADNVVTIPETEGVSYVDATETRARALGDVLTGSITLVEGHTLTVRAVAAEGYAFADDATTQWSFTFQAATGGGDGDAGSTGTGGGSTAGSASDPSGSLPSTGGDADVIVWPTLLAAILALGIGLGAVRLGRRQAT